MSAEWYMAVGGQQAPGGVVEDPMGRTRWRRRTADLYQVIYLSKLVEANEAVDLWNRRGQFRSELIHHTASDQQPSATAGLSRRCLQDGIDRLFSRLLDEAAGVDDDRFGRVDVVDDVVALPAQLAQHDLAVDAILGATETDQADAAAYGAFTHGGRF